MSSAEYNEIITAIEDNNLTAYLYKDGDFLQMPVLLHICIALADLYCDQANSQELSNEVAERIYNYIND